MSKKKARKRTAALPDKNYQKALQPLLILFFFILSILVVHFGSRPKSYDLSISDASPYDIEAPRSIVNLVETKRRANEAMTQVTNKMFHSEEISTQSVSRVKNLMDLTASNRAQLYRLPKEGQAAEGQEETAAARLYRPSASEVSSATTQLLSEVKQSMEYDLKPEDAQALLEMNEGRFENFRINVNGLATVIMQMPLDELALGDAVRDEVQKFSEKQPHYRSDNRLVEQILLSILQPNLAFNQEATENARQDAYKRVMQNPIMINRGTRIVSEGDIITDQTYAWLMELNLLDDDATDYLILAGHSLLILLLTLFLLMYLQQFKPELLQLSRESLVLALALILPLIVSAYLGQSNFALPPVFFTPVVICSYFGFQTAIVFSMALLTAVMPMVNFDPQFFVVGLIGCLLAAMLTKQNQSQNNFAQLLLGVLVGNALTAFAYALMQRVSFSVMSVSVVSSLIAGVSSVIAAIGLMPLLELIFNTVSPTRLIALSQPGHPLMKRLFLEAPGTSQHSMMVANLADAAAEAVGANSLICRVGSYYHDIGKLEAPLMFTENQKDYNPHDFISHEESARIITRHTETGLQMGRKNHLPEPVLRIIHEHHGSTMLQYFYQKAVEEAKALQLPDPDPDLYRYHCPIPSSRESAIVMLADTTEAAMKSTGIKELGAAEQLMRKLLKTKNEQNQFLRSGLSYADVEAILQAFLQVYAGHFHERIKYPDATDRRDTPRADARS